MLYPSFNLLLKTHSYILTDSTNCYFLPSSIIFLLCVSFALLPISFQLLLLSHCFHSSFLFQLLSFCFLFLFFPIVSLPFLLSLVSFLPLPPFSFFSIITFSLLSVWPLLLSSHVPLSEIAGTYLPIPRVVAAFFSFAYLTEGAFGEWGFDNAYV